MKIAAYDITSTSARSYERTEITQSSLLVESTQVLAAPAADPDRLSISEQAMQALEDNRQALRDQADELLSSTNKTAKAAGLYKEAPVDPLELKIRMLEMMISALTGKSFRFNRPKSLQPSGEGDAQTGQSLAQTVRTNAQMVTRQSIHERESVSYQARGVVLTADGQQLDIDIGMSMSREFSQTLETRMGVSLETTLADPLMINYGGTAASLSGESFRFDLDADGQMDNIAFAGQGNGFLALDKNGDGVINDGRELFGPQSGSGFGELRGYDKDGNGWIDENDSVYAQLRVWSKDAEGRDQLFTLKELDIGAIYLGDIETQYSMNNAQNATQGVMRSTSFYLKDSGGAGTISHVDLAL